MENKKKTLDEILLEAENMQRQSENLQGEFGKIKAKSFQKAENKKVRSKAFKRIVKISLTTMILALTLYTAHYIFDLRVIFNRKGVFTEYVLNKEFDKAQKLISNSHANWMVIDEMKDVLLNAQIADAVEKNDPNLAFQHLLTLEAVGFEKIGYSDSNNPYTDYAINFNSKLDVIINGLISRQDHQKALALANNYKGEALNIGEIEDSDTEFQSFEYTLDYTHRDAKINEIKQMAGIVNIKQIQSEKVIEMTKTDSIGSVAVTEGDSIE